MTNYAFEHNGTAFTPNGVIETPDVETHNRHSEALEIDWLKSAPEKVFLYVKSRGGFWDITTWPGTDIATGVCMGDSVPVGGVAGRDARKRSVDCRIFGVRYVGWYYETAGDYCRLKKAKRQA